MRINREKILKDFLYKIYEAKKHNMKDVRMTINELDDLSYVIYELMSEDISKRYSVNDTDDVKKTFKPNKTEIIDVSIPVRKSKEDVITESNQENYKEEINNTNIDLTNDDIDDNIEESDESDDVYLYGGSF